MPPYYTALVVLGLAILGSVVLPRLLSDWPLSFPIVYISGGVLIFSLPLGLSPPQPLDNPQQVERLTELVVIIALTGAGLKLDRPFDWRGWSSTWRLLGIAMPLTIAITAFLSWQFLGLHVATAVLIGAVIAPTDPVLAADVQTGGPTEAVDEEVDPAEQEGTIRFALTSEAGLNDGLAFPFTYLAIALAAAAGTGVSSWALDWFLVDFVYRIAVGGVVGYLIGKALAHLVFGDFGTTELARVMAGAEALAATLLSYGATELLHGYGFIAVFVTALVLRHHEWEHSYYDELHDFAVVVERILTAIVLVLFGGAIAGGLLSPLSVPLIAFGLVLVLVIRPLSGMISLFGSSMLWIERGVVSAFGIRGIGSFYYLAYALNEASFQQTELLLAADEIWALVGFIVVLSSVLHGSVVTSVMNFVDQWRAENKEGFNPNVRSEAE